MNKEKIAKTIKEEIASVLSEIGPQNVGPGSYQNKEDPKRNAIEKVATNFFSPQKALVFYMFAKYQAEKHYHTPGSVIEKEKDPIKKRKLQDDVGYKQDAYRHILASFMLKHQNPDVKVDRVGRVLEKVQMMFKRDTKRNRNDSKRDLMNNDIGIALAEEYKDQSLYTHEYDNIVKSKIDSGEFMTDQQKEDGTLKNYSELLAFREDFKNLERRRNLDKIIKMAQDVLDEPEDPKNQKKIATPKAPYQIKLKEIIKQELKFVLEEKKKKAGTESGKENNLRDWFKRKGAKGKKGGWVDCNTCRKDPKTGRKKCKACGRSSGEERSKYPSCRPTPGACGESGRGKSWGKKSARGKK